MGFRHDKAFSNRTALPSRFPKPRDQRVLKRWAVVDLNHLPSSSPRRSLIRIWIDEDAREKLEKEYFRKRILVTNRHTWSDQDILIA